MTKNLLETYRKIQNKMVSEAGGIYRPQTAKPAATPTQSSGMPTSGVQNSSWFSRRTDMQRATQDAGRMAVDRLKASKVVRPGERVPGEKVGTQADLMAAMRRNKAKDVPQNTGMKGSPLDQTQGARPEVARDYRLNKMRQNPPALDTTQKTVAQSQAPMRQAQNRADLAKSVQAGRVGDPGKQNFIQNARAQKEKVKAAGGDGSQYLPKARPNDPVVNQAMRDRAKEVNDNERVGGRPQTLSPGAGASAKPLNPAQVQGQNKSFFTDAERKSGKLSKERLDAWKADQQKRGVTDVKKLSLGNALNDLQGKTAVAGGKNDRSAAQQTLNKSVATQKAMSPTARGGKPVTVSEGLMKRIKQTIKEARSNTPVHVSTKGNLAKRMGYTKSMGQQNTAGGKRYQEEEKKIAVSKKKDIINNEPSQDDLKGTY